MRKKKRNIYYTDPRDDIYISNIVNGRGNMIAILVVPRSSNYVPPYIDRFINCEYMPDVRLIAKEYKSGYNYYVYDVNFTLMPQEEVTDGIINYINGHIFDLKFE